MLRTAEVSAQQAVNRTAVTRLKREEENYITHNLANLANQGLNLGSQIGSAAH